MSSNTPQRTPLVVWWIVWAAMLVCLLVLYPVFGRGSLPPVNRQDLVMNLVGFVPLFISIIVRWLVLPRFDDLKRAFPMFLVGLALAVACGIVGLLLGGPYRDSLFVLGVLGVASYVPFFAQRLGESKRAEFTPNN
ncbi:MAG: hypothetical protein WDM96_14420 [Lacunisphaera sp.]